MISTKYVGALAVSCALALVPISIHSYIGLIVDDGIRAASLPVSVDGFTSDPVPRPSSWGEPFDSHDWSERRLQSAEGDVLLSLIRTYDLKRAYHHPELAVAYGTSFTSHEVTRSTADHQLAVHVLRNGLTGSTAAYALHYGGRFIDDPIAFQVRTAAQLLVRGRRPITLVFARDLARVADRPLDSWPSMRVLTAASATLAR